MSEAQLLADVGVRMNSSMKSALASRQFWLLLINAAVIAGLGILRPETFLSWINFKAVLSLMSYDLLLAVAMTTVLIVRGLDLSVGSVMALSSVVMALLLREGYPVFALGDGWPGGCAPLWLYQRLLRRQSWHSSVSCHLGHDDCGTRHRDGLDDRAIYFLPPCPPLVLQICPP